MFSLIVSTKLIIIKPPFVEVKWTTGLKIGISGEEIVRPQQLAAGGAVFWVQVIKQELINLGALENTRFWWQIQCSGPSVPRCSVPNIPQLLPDLCRISYLFQLEIKSRFAPAILGSSHVDFFSAMHTHIHTHKYIVYS